ARECRAGGFSDRRSRPQRKLSPRPRRRCLCLCQRSRPDRRRHRARSRRRWPARLHRRDPWRRRRKTVADAALCPWRGLCARRARQCRPRPGTSRQSRGAQRKGRAGRQPRRGGAALDHDAAAHYFWRVTVLERPTLLPEPFSSWFASRGWTPRAHQLELLAKAQAGRSVLLIAPTGGGKTLAGFLPSLVELSGAQSKSRSAPLARSAPSPLVGEGGGRGSRGDAKASTLAPDLPTPTPDPSPQGGGEKKRLISTGRGIRREGGL